jgi:hypothetical protein
MTTLDQLLNSANTPNFSSAEFNREAAELATVVDAERLMARLRSEKEAKERGDVVKDPVNIEEIKEIINRLRRGTSGIFLDSPKTKKIKSGGGEKREKLPGGLDELLGLKL